MLVRFHVIYQVYSLKKVMPWVQWAYIYRRNFFVENNIQFNTKIAISEDVYFNQACMLANIQVYKSELSMYVHRMRADSTGNTNLYTPSRLNDTFIIASDLMDQYGSRNIAYAHRLATGCFVEAFYSVYTHTNSFKDFQVSRKSISYLVAHKSVRHSQPEPAASQHQVRYRNHS